MLVPSDSTFSGNCILPRYPAIMLRNISLQDIIIIISPALFHAGNTLMLGDELLITYTRTLGEGRNKGAVDMEAVMTCCLI